MTMLGSHWHFWRDIDVLHAEIVFGRRRYPAGPLPQAPEGRPMDKISTTKGGTRWSSALSACEIAALTILCDHMAPADIGRALGLAMVHAPQPITGNGPSPDSRVQRIDHSPALPAIALAGPRDESRTCPVVVVSLHSSCAEVVPLKAWPTKYGRTIPPVSRVVSVPRELVNHNPAMAIQALRAMPPDGTRARTDGELMTMAWSVASPGQALDMAMVPLYLAGVLFRHVEGFGSRDERELCHAALGALRRSTGLPLLRGPATTYLATAIRLKKLGAMLAELVRRRNFDAFSALNDSVSIIDGGCRDLYRLVHMQQGVSQVNLHDPSETHLLTRVLMDGALRAPFIDVLTPPGRFLAFAAPLLSGLVASSVLYPANAHLTHLVDTVSSTICEHTGNAARLH